MGQAPSLFLAAGEVSGDMHGARLAAALLERRPDLILRGIGSTRMREAGVEILADVTPHSAVGILEHLPGLRPIARAYAAARADLQANPPAGVVLIDYQGANMDLAAHARKMGRPTLYYIAPQEWIWGFKGGCRKVASVTDLILAVFAPEADAYRAAGGNVEFIGHPLLDMVPPSIERGAWAARWGLEVQSPIVALFPGSRRMEVERLLPAMLAASQLVREQSPETQFLLPIAAPALAGLIREQLGSGWDGVKVLEDVPGMAVMQVADVVLAASGTGILEAAVVGTPVVATYRVGMIAAFLAHRLMRGRYVTLPNILTGEGIVPELLQDQANGKRMASEVLALLEDPGRRTQMLAGLKKVRRMLGEPGAVGRAASRILATAGIDEQRP